MFSIVRTAKSALIELPDGRLANVGTLPQEIGAAVCAVEAEGANPKHRSELSHMARAGMRVAEILRESFNIESWQLHGFRR